MIRKLTYDIDGVVPYINWALFYHAWNMGGKPKDAKGKLRSGAYAFLDTVKNQYETHALLGIFDANSDGDDLIIGGVRLPLLRQQHQSTAGEPNLCLSDFVRPASSGVKDKVGVFAVSVDADMVRDNSTDPYITMMAQVMSDRLAEATVEKLHEETRKTYWGYVPDEHLTIDELFKGKYQGIRPAAGYPSIPDTSVNFIISDLIGMKAIGTRLTATGMMIPHSSVSGLMLAHPQSRYFDVGRIGEDQLKDYAKRRGLPVEAMRKYLNSNLTRK